VKITAITAQVKRAGRYSIYVDGKFALGLGGNDVLNLGLHNGQEITEAELTDLKQQSDFGKIYEKTLNLLSFRQRSEWELRDYLKRKNQSPAIIEKLLNVLSNLGYVDDKKFATAWVDNRRLLKPISSLKLRAELKQKRIANNIIDEVLKADTTDEITVLRELIDRKSKRYPDQQKLMAYLARQGFRYDDIKQALRAED
jgi:regulatory protein